MARAKEFGVCTMPRLKVQGLSSLKSFEPDMPATWQGGDRKMVPPRSQSPEPLPRIPSTEQVQRQVKLVLAAASFSQAERTRKFLKYIVDQTLAGNAKRLKQYTIATEVLGRDTNFDPDADPVVRLEAGKLRRALENYYLRGGAADQLRISVPKGGYVPVFDFFDARSGVASGAHSAKREIVRESPAGIFPNLQRVVVLPLNVQFQSEECRAFSEGLVEQLVVELSRYRDFAILSFNGGEKADEPPANPLAPAVELNARFVVSGSVRGSGTQLRATVRLHDVQTLSIIWSDSFDLDAKPTRSLEAQDRIARHVAGVIADYYGVISHTLTLQSVHATDGPWTLQNAILRHRYLARTLTEKVYRLARPDLEHAIEHAAHHPMVWAALAHTIFYGNVLGFDDDPDWMTLVYRYAQRSFELDHKCAFGHVVMALHELYRRDFDDVFETCDRITEGNPHAPSTRLSAGFFRALAGDWDAGADMLSGALGTLLHPPGWAYRVTFLNHYRKKSYGRALHEINKYHAPEHFTPPLLRAAALAQLGRIEEAKIARSEVLRICPRFYAISDRYFRYLIPFDDLADHLKSGLHKAGFSF